MWDGREPSLASQAIDATLGHAQAVNQPGSADVAQIVDFESQIYDAQAMDSAAGWLAANGATFIMGKSGTGYLLSTAFMGGIGGRGPGETKLEINRRRVRDRIHRLEKGMKNIQKGRNTRRSGREKAGLPVVSIVGYTNAGKSTLLKIILGREEPDAGEGGK